MTVSVVLLDPSDSAFVTIDWSDVLSGGLTLGAVTHTVPSPLTKISESTDALLGLSQVKVSGAVHGGLYMIEAQSTLSNGETVNRQFPVRGWNS